MKKSKHENSQQLDDILGEHATLKANVAEAAERIASPTFLGSLLDECSPIQPLIENWVNGLSQTSHDHGLKKVNAAMDGLLGCLTSAKDLIVSEREQRQQDAEMLCREMDKKLAEHVKDVEGNISIWEKRVTKGSKLLEHLSAVIEEVKGKLAKTAASDNDKQNEEACITWEV